MMAADILDTVDTAEVGLRHTKDLEVGNLPAMNYHQATGSLAVASHFLLIQMHYSSFKQPVCHTANTS